MTGAFVASPTGAFVVSPTGARTLAPLVPAEKFCAIYIDETSGAYYDMRYAPDSDHNQALRAQYMEDYARFQVIALQMEQRELWSTVLLGFFPVWGLWQDHPDEPLEHILVPPDAPFPDEIIRAEWYLEREPQTAAPFVDVYRNVAERVTADELWPTYHYIDGSGSMIRMTLEPGFSRFLEEVQPAVEVHDEPGRTGENWLWWFVEFLEGVLASP